MNRLHDEITGKGGKAIAVQGDVSKSADVKRLFAETKKAFGPPDVLVNNAGVFEFERARELRHPAAIGKAAGYVAPSADGHAEYGPLRLPDVSNSHFIYVPSK